MQRSSGTRGRRLRSPGRKLSADYVGLTMAAIVIFSLGYIFWQAMMFDLITPRECSQPFAGWYFSSDHGWPLVGAMALSIVLLFYWNLFVTLDALVCGEGKAGAAISIGIANAIVVGGLSWMLWGQFALAERERFWAEAKSLGWNATLEEWPWDEREGCEQAARFVGVWAIEEIDRPPHSEFPEIEFLEFLPSLEVLAHSGPLRPYRTGRYRTPGPWAASWDLHLTLASEHGSLHLLWAAEIRPDEIVLTTPELWDLSQVEVRLRRMGPEHARGAQIERLNLGLMDW